MRTRNWWRQGGRLMRLMAGGSSVFLLGGCALSDQQITSIFSSVITSGLSTLLNAFITTAVDTAAGGA